ncbi:MAG: BTAD domain-containing putative transcriptional regulator [Actinobacteria bacterium]|nr:BTAD domain-containing putative transcriptional regulator [Actinomycetota bacterium]
MEFRILGPIEVVDNGRSIDLGSPQQRGLLALLLIHANRVVTTDRILEELWGDDAAGKENALWVYVSRLRSVFEPDRVDRGQSSVLLTRDHGYLLNVDPGSIDAWEFEEAAARGRELIKDDPEAASEVLARALQLWRGSALEDFAYHDFARMEVVRLEELRLSAVEGRIEADLRRGKAGELVGELESLRSMHPMRESFVGQLMLALYQSGRQADALRTFERFQRHVGEELGIEPSPELRRLEEQVLLHDSRIRVRLPGVERVETVTRAARNPFKGLRSFYEDDSSDFFGRDRLVADVVRRIGQGERLIALVGPSGSGKSSVVRAGLIPAVRKGAIAGSGGWQIAQMVPGARPFAELEVALLRSSLDVPDSLAGQLADGEDGMLRAALRVLPRGDSRLLLVIDQFEELFTLVEDDDERSRFISNLLPVMDDPHRRVTVVLTLRADFYDRPLAYPEFADRLGKGVVNVAPLTPDELEDAAQKPGESAGVSLAPTLLASLLSDVVGQPGALPLFQYTLTELFDRRVDDTLTLESYRSMDGLRGALTRRADDLFIGLDSKQRLAAQQLFLRLVTIADSDEWGRRRVPASEIVSLDVDLVAVHDVIELFTAHRLLTVDRDFVTESPTIEVAHEALLTEWGRLRGWIEESREDVKWHAALTSAMNEWIESDRHVDFLLTTSRLEGYEQWAATATMQLTADERLYLDAAIEMREQVRVAEQERVAREARTAQTARRRLWGLAVAVALLAAVAVGIVVVAFAPERPSVAFVFHGRGSSILDDILVTGLDDASRDFDFKAEEITPPFADLEGKYRQLAESGTDLIIPAIDLAAPIAAVAPEYPDTRWVVVDRPGSPGVTAVSFADEEVAYLVGAAAALTSDSGTIGFVGGFQYDEIERFRAGYEAGALAVDPDVVVLASYVSAASVDDAFSSKDLAKAAATNLYQQGADVVFHAAGQAGLGVFEAAQEQTSLKGKRQWAIGNDTDQYLGVNPLLGRHILTSAFKKLDVVVYGIIKDFLEGNLEPTVEILALADGALDFSTSGGHLTEEIVAEMNRLKQDIVSGRRTVPIAATGLLDPPPEVEDFTVATVTFDGARCVYEGGPTFLPGDVVRFDFINATPADANLIVYTDRSAGIALMFAARGNGENSGFVTMVANSHYSISCNPELRNFDPAVPGPSLTVENGP